MMAEDTKAGESEVILDVADNADLLSTERIYTKQDRFIHGLDGLRFIAAVWLFWEHMGWGWTIPGWDYLVNMQYRGQIPLQFFFLMGGMVLYSAYFKSKDFSKKKTKVDFWLGRLSRVGPNYYLTLFIEIPIVISDAYNRTVNNYWSGWSIAAIIYGIITTPFMLQGWTIPNQMAYASWYWGTLLWAMSPFAFYWFLFPWLVRFVERDRSMKLDYIYLAIFYILAVLPFFILFLLASIPRWAGSDPILSCTDCVYWWMREFPPLRISSQLIGMFLAKIWIHAPLKVKKSIVTGIIGDIAFITLIACALFIPDNPDLGRADDYAALLDTVLTPLQCLTMFALACRKGCLSFLLSFRVFKYCGKMSFGIWSYQSLSYYVFAYFAWDVYWWVSLIAFFVLIGFSIISLELYEEETRKKFLKLSRYFPESWKTM